MCNVHPGCYLPYSKTGACDYDFSAYPELNGIFMQWEFQGCRGFARLDINEVTCQRMASVYVLVHNVIC